MKQRCYNSNNKDYPDYGERGITICREWKNDFKAFYDWAINNGYAENLEIERIDNNENYEPSNCKWATRKEQNNNTRHNHYIELNGEIHTMKEWAKIIGLSYQTLSSRINKLHWNIEKALTK